MSKKRCKIIITKYYNYYLFMNIIKNLPKDIKLYINSFVPQKYCVSCYKKIFSYSNNYLVFCSIRCRCNFYFIQFKMIIAVLIIYIYMFVIVLFNCIPAICMLFVIFLILLNGYNFIVSINFYLYFYLEKLILIFGFF